MTNEIILIVFAAALIGLFLGAILVYLSMRGKIAGKADAFHEAEKERVRLETETGNLKQNLAAKTVELEARSAELAAAAKNVGELSSNLDVANDRLAKQTDQSSQLAETLQLRDLEMQRLNNQHSHLAARFDSLTKQFNDAENKVRQQTNRIEDLETFNHKLDSEKTAATLQVQFLSEKLATQKNEIEEIRKKSETEFENIANRLLEIKSQKFTAANQENMEKILKPLNEEIVLFKKKVDDTYDKESKERFSLGEKVRELIATTDKVSAEANNLAVALKGQAKTQGNWGELILERILEMNGLQKGRNFDVQYAIKSSDGNQQFLDAVVYLPDNRKLIIDSKVTLVAYDRYCAAETDEDRDQNLREHLKALSNHIDSLSKKRYSDMKESSDFVMLFVPIEPAYLTAMQHDSELWARAYNKHVLLISPTNLMAAVRLVVDLWKRDDQSKNHQQIAEQGKKLYDKFALFLENMDRLGDSIRKSQETYDKAFGQLKTGRGNLIRSAEQLAKLGIKPAKALPAAFQNYETEEEAPETDEITI